MVKAVSYISELLNISPFAKALSKLREHDLFPQEMLLKSGKRRFGYIEMSDEQRDLEIKLLNKHVADPIAALKSLIRFNNAKDICLEFELFDEANFLQQYVDLYEFYIKEKIKSIPSEK
jgi:hypothetical protein